MTAESMPASADTLTSTDRNLAVASQLLSLVSWGVPGLGLVGPLLIWLFKGRESPFAAAHARESINFQITLSLASIAWVTVITLLLMSFGFDPFFMIVVLIAAGFCGTLLVICAALAASQGRPYRYPLTIHFFR